MATEAKKSAISIIVERKRKRKIKIIKIISPNIVRTISLKTIYRR